MIIFQTTTKNLIICRLVSRQWDFILQCGFLDDWNLADCLLAGIGTLYINWKAVLAPGGKDYAT